MRFPWRADPVLQALCKPAIFLAKVIGLGYHTRQEVEHTWQGKDQRVGPVNALKAALGQAGTAADCECGATMGWASAEASGGGAAVPAPPPQWGAQEGCEVWPGQWGDQVVRPLWAHRHRINHDEKSDDTVGPVS
mgnify:CR=1 FL=1